MVKDREFEKDSPPASGGVEAVQAKSMRLAHFYCDKMSIAVSFWEPGKGRASRARRTYLAR
jgi:hypothetical protein